MNKAGLQKNVGAIVKLDPSAISTNGKRLDDDWLVTEVGGLAIKLRNQRTNGEIVLANDAVYSFFSDADRTTASKVYGILQLLSQVTIAIDGTATIRPLPPPRRSLEVFPAERFNPLVLVLGGRERYYSWQARDPVHLATEERPKQLMGMYESLCHALRVETGREPEFQPPAFVGGDLVFELSPDFRARWPLLGGAGGDAGSAMLVLTEKVARLSNGGELLEFGRTCPCGRGRAKFEISRNEIVRLLAKNELALYCIMCDETQSLDENEIAKLKERL